MQIFSKHPSLAQKSLFVSGLWLAAASLVQAHPNHAGSINFGHGFSHPLNGWDHILAMFAVGLWAAQLGGRAVWIVPSVFVGTMALGGLCGMSGVPIPGFEQGIIASVFVLGLLITAGTRFPVWASALIVALFALFHGYAHGAEMPANSSGLAYAGGFVFATALLHAGGIALGMTLLRIANARIVQAAGAAIIAGGFFLLLA